MATLEAVQWAGEAPGGEPDQDQDQDQGGDPGANGGSRRGARAMFAGPTELGRGFAEQLLNDARGTPAAPAAPGSGSAGPGVDWRAIWATARDAESREQSEGRLVLTAFQAATALKQSSNAGGEGSPNVGIALLERDRPAPKPLTVPPSTAHPPRDARRHSQGVAEQAIGKPAAPAVAVSLGRRQKLATVFGWIRNIGLIVILFAAWQVWGTSIAQHQAQDSLQTQFRSQVHHITPPTASGPRLIDAAVRVPEPGQGSVVARIQIPSIGVDQYVVEGTAEPDLAKGPGHYVGTAMPGQAGNVAIAGHRTTYGAPFNSLDRVTPGAHILLTSGSGEQLDYVVTQPPVAVPPSDVAVLNAFGDNRLTLTTCNPRFSASQRLVVVALLREAAGSGSTTTARTALGGTNVVHGRARQIPSGGSVGWNLLYLPGVIAVLGVMLLLGFANKRAKTYFGSRGRWLILPPIWVAVTYLLFGLLTSFVPATL